MVDSTDHHDNDARGGRRGSHDLLHALIEELDRRVAIDEVERGREIERALELFAQPAAIFDRAAAGPIACNGAWSTALGKSPAPPAIRRALAAAARERAGAHLAPIRIRDHRYVAATRSLATRGALVTLHGTRAARPPRPHAAFLEAVAHSLRGPLATTLLWERALRDRGLRIRETETVEH